MRSLAIEVTLNVPRLGLSDAELNSIPLFVPKDFERTDFVEGKLPLEMCLSAAASINSSGSPKGFNGSLSSS